MKKIRNGSILLIAIAGLFISGCKKEKNDTETEQPSDSQVNIGKVDEQVKAFISKYNVPGASLAVTQNGKLVYRKGYGFADIETNEKVTADHRFRLASISKTYTGVAMMKLVQEGKLSLDDKVFGTGAILGTEYGKQPYAVNLTKITVSNLLHNTAGGWGAASGGDPIDQQPALNNTDFLNWVLKNKPLRNVPGTKYDYSNTGFFIAGRIIEKISGKSYSAYIKDMVSAFGDKNTDHAASSLAARKANEVKYYGQGAVDFSWVYSMSLNRRDADGGLITTATDLLRLVTAIDGSSSRPDILNASSLKALTTGSGPAPANPNYGLGIGLWGDIWYNYGSLPGTRTGFMRSTNGKCIALLLNSRVENDAFVYAMQDLMVGILNDTGIKWQDIDQF